MRKLFGPGLLDSWGILLLCKSRTKTSASGFSRQVLLFGRSHNLNKPALVMDSLRLQGWTPKDASHYQAPHAKLTL